MLDIQGKTTVLNHTVVVNNQLVHATGAKCGADRIYNRLTSIDVANELWLALGCVCSLLQEDDWGSLEHAAGFMHTCLLLLTLNYVQS